MTLSNLSVLIPDGESHFALFVARCLIRVPNLQLHVLSSDPWAPLRLSRHRRTFCSQQMAQSDAQRLDDITRTVKRMGIDVLLPVDEPAVRFASTHLQDLKELAAIPPIPDLETFEKVTNKWLLAKFLKENDIPGPPTILFSADASFGRDLQALEFPVLAKPTRGRGGEGIHYFDRPPELLRFLEHIANESPTQYVVQSFVHGYDVDCSVLCKDGKILAYTVQKGLIAGSQSFAASAGIDFIQDEQVFDVADSLVSAANWSGIAHIDLRYDEQEKRPKLVEVNARYWGSLIGSLTVGVNFPHLACLAALDVSFPTPVYRLGRYFAPGAAIKNGIRRFLGQSVPHYTFEETALPHALGDPVAEVLKLVRQALAQNR